MTATHQFDAILPAPFSLLGVSIAHEHLRRLEFLPLDFISPSSESHSGLIRQIAEQIAAYLDDPSQRFTLPIEPLGSPFRLRVWEALQGIPAGQVVTYGELARRLGSSARAVGQALGDNPLPIIIPCHRVVAANGGLGGFNHSETGYSIDIKRWLLNHEAGARASRPQSA